MKLYLPKAAAKLPDASRDPDGAAAAEVGGCGAAFEGAGAALGGGLSSPSWSLDILPWIGFIKIETLKSSKIR